MGYYEPSREDKFTFGLWTVGNPGGDSFGQPVWDALSSVDIVHLPTEMEIYDVNFHHNTPRTYRRNAQRARSHRQRIQKGSSRNRIGRPHGNDRSVYRSRFQRWRLHEQ